MGSSWSSVAITQVVVACIQLGIACTQLGIAATKEFYPSVLSSLRRGPRPKPETDMLSGTWTRTREQYFKAEKR